tara:strand:- start:563 stop:1120 length:558 start_codon:yes stop_codon:yes gene_type:complete
MSQDPFQRDTDASTFTPDGTASPPKKKRRIWVKVIAALIGGGFLTLLICCGTGLYAVQNYGGFMFDPIRKDLNQMVELREQVGEIGSLNMNVFGTVEEGRNNPEYVIFDGQSEQGPFQVSVKMNPAGDLEKVFFVRPDGSRQPIDMTKRLESTSETSDAEVDQGTVEKPSDEPAETGHEKDRGAG